jgi:hypothetical protein
LENTRNHLEDNSGSLPKLSKMEVNRVFEKQAKYEQALDEDEEKKRNQRAKDRWLIDKTRRGQFPGDPLAREKRWKEHRREILAIVKQESRSNQRFLQKKRLSKHMQILKMGVPNGSIQIHETESGFEIETPQDKVAEYLRQHLGSPNVEDLREGHFLLCSLRGSMKERVRLLREAIIGEFAAKDPSDMMLVDMAVSNYYRAMYATRLETESMLSRTDYPMEMLEVYAKGVQPYINACQNQLLKILDALRLRRQRFTPYNSITYRSVSRTDINLNHWGIPLLLALFEITSKKEENIDLDEVKRAMAKHVDGINAADIPNEWVGHALRRYGFTEKVHTSDGNHYNITRRQVELVLSNEGLKL